jgi:hypothetical protein
MLSMSRSIALLFVLLVCGVAVSSKDKTVKVTYREMALGMRDAFNCGVVVEEYRIGKFKDNADAYHKEKETYNCDHVEEVLNTLNDQAPAPPSQ